MEPAHDQYFSAAPRSASRPGSVELILPDLTVTLATDRGLFSPDRIDPGTRVLLREAPAPRTTPTIAVDLGCGYGPIARVLAARFPDAAIWAVDVNERARAVAKANLADCPRATVAAPDEVPPDLPVDLLWSNPPIRIGKAALHELLVDWFGRLTPEGEAVLVVQKHLGADSLLRWLNEEGWPTERVASRQAYRLLRVRPA